METQSPKHMMVLISVMIMILVALAGGIILSSCSMSFHRHTGEINGNHAASTELTITAPKI